MKQARKGNEQSLKEAIRSLLVTYKLTSKVNEAKLQSSWANLMGKSIANRTTELFIKDKKLYIRLSSAVLREEMSYSKEKVIKIVNQELGEEAVKEIVLF